MQRYRKSSAEAPSLLERLCRDAAYLMQRYCKLQTLEAFANGIGENEKAQRISPRPFMNDYWIALSFDCCNSGKDLAFDGFEQCAAAGRHVGNFVGNAEFVDACDRVAAANQ